MPRYNRLKIILFGLVAGAFLLAAAFSLGSVIAKAGEVPVVHDTKIITVQGPTKTEIKTVKVPGPVTREVTSECKRYIEEMSAMIVDFKNFSSSYGNAYTQINDALAAIARGDIAGIVKAQTAIQHTQSSDRDSLNHLAQSIPNIDNLRTECESSQ